MKNQILKLAIGLLTVTTLITSCKKNEGDAATPATQTCKVTSFKNIESKDSTVNVFDAQNRLVKSLYYAEDGSLSGSYDTYTYAPNKVTYTSYSDALAIEYQTQYILNSNGYLNYQVEISDHNGIDTEYDTSFYTYNAEGYNTMVVYKTQYVGVNNHTYYDTSWNVFTDGNMTSSTFKTSTGETSTGETSTEIYTYTNLADKDHFYDGGLMLIPNLYGVPNKNLPLLGTDADGTYTREYTYEINAEGYATRRTAKYVNTLHPGTSTSDTKIYHMCN